MSDAHKIKVGEVNYLSLFLAYYHFFPLLYLDSLIHYALYHN